MANESPFRCSRRRLLGVGLGTAIAAGAGLALPPTTRAVGLSRVTATVNVDVLNVRAGPSAARAIVGEVRRGTTVACTATSGSWFKITSGSLRGWVSSPYVTLVPRYRVTTYDRGRTDLPLLALTFDAGSDRGYAGSILDTLERKRVQATFGLTGRWVEANPDLVARIVADGHELINHTLTHGSFTGRSTNAAPLTPAQRLGEVMRTEEILAAAAGAAARPWFRPPYGDYDSGVLRDIGAAGFRYNAMWSVDSLGWNGLSRDQIVDRCLGRHGNGYIYLLHVGAQSQDGPALARLINGFRARGYGFGTMDEVVGLVAPSALPQVAGAAEPTQVPAPTEVPAPPAATQTPVPLPTPESTVVATPA